MGNGPLEISARDINLASRFQKEASRLRVLLNAAGVFMPRQFPFANCAPHECLRCALTLIQEVEKRGPEYYAGLRSDGGNSANLLGIAKGIMLSSGGFLLLQILTEHELDSWQRNGLSI